MPIRCLLLSRRLLILALTFLPTVWIGPARAQVSEGALQGPLADFVSGTPAPLSTPGVTPPESDYQPAKVRLRVPVGYPLLADLNRVEGIVTIRFYIDETGRVTRTAAVAGPRSNVLLDELSGDPRLLQWTFVPATLAGKPVPSTHDQEFEFRLDQEQQKKIALHRLVLPVGMPDPPYPATAASGERPRGDVTVSVHWTKLGLVGAIALDKSSGSSLLDTAALRFVYENWRVDPTKVKPDQPFVRTINFAPPR